MCFHLGSPAACGLSNELSHDSVLTPQRRLMPSPGLLSCKPTFFVSVWNAPARFARIVDFVRSLACRQNAAAVSRPVLLCAPRQPGVKISLAFSVQ